MENETVRERHFLIKGRDYHLKLITEKYKFVRHESIRSKGTVECEERFKGFLLKNRKPGRFTEQTDHTDPDVDYYNLTIYLNDNLFSRKIRITEVCTDTRGKETLRKMALEKKAGLFKPWKRIKSFYEVEDQERFK